MAIPTTKTTVAARVILVIVGMAGSFFLTAGTLKWPAGWTIVCIQGIFTSATTVWLWRHNPRLLHDRLTLWNKAKPRWDKFVVAANVVLSAMFLLLPGLDAVRFQWSHVPGALRITGLVMYLLFLLLLANVVRTNTFLFPIGQIDRERGHHLIDRGPYGYIRHPMYAAIMGYLLCIPLILGSAYTLLVAAAMTGVFVFRTYFEDKTLHRELEGYADYAQRVRYRIVPGIW